MELDIADAKKIFPSWTRYWSKLRPLVNDGRGRRDQESLAKRTIERRLHRLKKFAAKRGGKDDGLRHVRIKVSVHLDRIHSLRLESSLIETSDRLRALNSSWALPDDHDKSNCNQMG
jgi:hypothetical protein